MSKPEFLTLNMETGKVSLAEGIASIDSEQEIEILRTMDEVHNWFGPIKVTLENLQTIFNNFKSNVVGIKLSIDYDHDMEESAGWVTDLRLAGEKILGKIKWTPAGQKAIQDGEYIYFSPTFSFDYTDSKGNHFGPTLLGGGLTNHPFIKDFSPLIIFSSKTPQGKQTPIQRKPEVKEQNKIQTETPKMEIKELNDKLVELQASDAKRGLEVKDLSDKVKTLSDENVSLKARNVELVKEMEAEKKLIRFNDFLRQGKLLPAHKDVFMSLPDDKAIAFAEANPVLVNLASIGANGAPIVKNGTVDMSDADYEQAEKMGVSAATYAKANRMNDVRAK